MSHAICMSAILLAASAAGAAEYRLDPARSTLVVHVHKKGLFSAFEHDHHFHPQRWGGRLDFDAEPFELTRLEIVVDAASLVDEQPKLSHGNRQKVEEQVRSPVVLDAARFPEVRYTAERLELRGHDANEPSAVKGALMGTLQLHGQTRALPLEFVAHNANDEVSASGQVAFSQGDFGIRAMSKGGGAIAVEDRVVIEFTAHFVPADEAP
jgi:polyisoprenoid-binding protein YceI